MKNNEGKKSEIQDESDNSKKNYKDEQSVQQESVEIQNLESQAKKTTKNLNFNEIINGFSYIHAQSGKTNYKVYDALTGIYALTELLIEKGIIGLSDLEKRKTRVREEILKAFQDEQIGVRLRNNDVPQEKIDEGVKIDCLERLPICKGACCKLTFSLSQSEVNEKIVRWDLGNPYMIARDSDGYCVHVNKKTFKCEVYDKRPKVCRAYDCRNDKRIWLDFEKKIINPELNI